MTESDVIEFQVSFVGNLSVGKTSILHRHLYKSFQDNCQTVGYNIFSESLSKKTQSFDIKYTDTSGNPYYQDTIMPQIRSSHCIVIVADPSQQKDQIESCYNSIVPILRKKTVIFYLVVNKSDLIQESVEGNLRELQFLADSLKMTFCQVSAKTGFGVEELFEGLIKKLVTCCESIKTDSVRLSGSRHSRRISEKKNSGCC